VQDEDSQRPGPQQERIRAEWRAGQRVERSQIVETQVSVVHGELRFAVGEGPDGDIMTRPGTAMGRNGSGPMIDGRRITAMVLAAGLLLGSGPGAVPALADEGPARRGVDGAERATRRADPGESAPRRGAEGEDALARRRREAEERRRKDETIELWLKPQECRVDPATKPFLKRLVKLKNPSESFTVETWSDKRDYWVHDSILYFFRANKDAYLTLFWIGPDGSIFIPFSNFKVEGGRDHKIDPKNIIVEPVGLERWRVLATPEPHEMPCWGDPDAVQIAIDTIRKGPHAVGVWEVRSHTYRERRWRPR